MTILSPDVFLKQHLMKLLLGLTQLHVFAITYNEVSGFGAGEIDTGESDLALTIQAGNLQYSKSSGQIAAALMFTPGLMDSERGLSLGREMIDDMETAAYASQHSLELKMRDVAVSDEVPTIAFIYVGATAFDQAVHYATMFKADHPNAKVVTLTCDCGEEEKIPRLNSLLNNGAIDFALMDGVCGGRTTLAYILKTTIARWKELEAGRAKARMFHQAYPFTYGMGLQESVNAVLRAGVTSGQGSYRLTFFTSYAGHFFNHLGPYLQSRLRESFDVTESDEGVLLTLM